MTLQSVLLCNHKFYEHMRLWENSRYYLVASEPWKAGGTEIIEQVQWPGGEGTHAGYREDGLGDF